MTGGNEQKPNGTGPPTASLSVGSTAVVVMGPSGCGKSTLASALAETLGWTFIEGDDHHPPENVEKMAGGEPLTDEDRLPFLKSVGRVSVVRTFGTTRGVDQRSVGLVLD
ncbi:AAA family ATPase [Roseibium sp.]|uniref:AAA family ATPase n=1 Tax=Roseibium sp. TaxID=1936156 RepID=UPI003298D487